MKRMLFNIFLVTAIMFFLLIFLYPQKLSEEIESDEIAISQLNTPDTTIYVPSQIDHVETIRQIMENYDMSVLSSNLNAYSEIFLGDIEVELQEIALKNATIYASMKINKFKKENDQIRGIYLNGYLFNNLSKRESIEKILTNTDVNTLVIDVKTDNGHILFDTDIEEVIYLNNERVKFTI